MEKRWMMTIVTCCVLLLTWAFAQEEGKEPELVRYVSEHFDIYARNEEVAKEKAKELENAAKEFKDLLGVPPVRGAIIFEPRAMMQDLVDRVLDGLKDGSIVQPLEMKPIVIDPAKYKGYEKGDVKYVLPWFERMFDEKPRTGTGFEALIARQIEQQLRLQTNALTHEVGHLMLIHWVGKETEGAKDEHRYGSPILPDWFDEAVAVYLEPAEMKATRRGLMKANLKRYIPFDQFFTMEHPGKGLGMDLIERMKEGKRPRVEDILPFSALAEAGMVFYPQCLSVLEFFIEIGGKGFVREMAEMLKQGKAITEIVERLPAEYPRKLTELEKLWLEWVERTYEDHQLPGLFLGEAGDLLKELFKKKDIEQDVAPKVKDASGDWFGATLEDAPESLKVHLGFDTTEEIVVVAALEESSHAANEGLRQYDLLLEFDGKRATVAKLLKIREICESGDTVNLTIIRKGEKTTLNFVIP